MKKEVWIRADEGDWEKKKRRITSGLEAGVSCVLVLPEDVDRAKELGDITVATFFSAEPSRADIIVVGKDSEGDGTLQLPVELGDSGDVDTIAHLRREKKTIAGFSIIHDKAHEKFATSLGEVCDYLIAIGTDWMVIPLENLIASLQKENVRIISGVRDSDEARLALETMEHGADGVLLDTDNPDTIRKTVEIAEEATSEKLELEVATVIRVEQVGMGDRVCVDTCSLMRKGEGMLVGCGSGGMFLVHSESEDSPYVASRPFRVNAGAVHAYVRTGGRTRYLCELEAGDEVAVVDADGKQRRAIVGRVKIERRPLMLVEAMTPGGRTVKNILQNAETIKLVSGDGNPVSVTGLKEGDNVLTYVEESGRHFGMKVEETIIEK